MARPLSRNDRFASGLVDIEEWHRDPSALIDRRDGTMVRKSTMPRAAVGQPRLTLQPDMSRLLTSTVIGSGSEGVAALVHQANYEEPVNFGGGMVPVNRTVVKLRSIEKIDGQLPVLVQRTVAREIVQGLIAAWLRLPFLTGVSDWWMWTGRVLPRPVLPHHLMPHFTKSLCNFDISDLFDEAGAAYIRERYVKLRHEPKPSGKSWRDAYYALRRRELESRRIVQLPLIVIEQSNAGDDTLWKMLRESHIIERSDAKWRYFSAQIRTIAAMTALLQADYGWIHGDMSAGNIILSSTKRELPPAFARLPPLPPPEFAGRLYVPSFIDLSRSAVRPSLAEAQFPTEARLRSPSFRNDAIAYVDGYANGAQFSRTADMRRLGLSLCTLIVGETCHPTRQSVTFEQLDARIVYVARMLLDVPAAWAATGDWAALRPSDDTCMARSRTFGIFLVNIAWVCDYMRRIEEMARTGASAVDLAYVRQRFELYMAMEREISHDLNPYSGWLLERHPHLADGDIRAPASVVLWDALAV